MSAAPPPLRDPTLAAYTLPVQRDDWGGLLAPFCPPLPAQGQVFLVSLFGDVFLEAADGQVWWVNPILARVDVIAASKAAFEQRLAAERAAFLKTPLIDALIASGRVVRDGQFYGLTALPRDGGRWSVDNVGASPVADAFAFWGAEFRKTQPAPLPGAQDKQKKKGWFS